MIFPMIYFILLTWLLERQAGFVCEHVNAGWKKAKKTWALFVDRDAKNRTWLLTIVNIWEISNNPNFFFILSQENGSADFLHARHIHAGTVFYQLKILHKWKARINNLIRRQKSRSWRINFSVFRHGGPKKKLQQGGQQQPPLVLGTMKTITF